MLLRRVTLRVERSPSSEERSALLRQPSRDENEQKVEQIQEVRVQSQRTRAAERRSPLRVLQAWLLRPQKRLHDERTRLRNEQPGLQREQLRAPIGQSGLLLDPPA